MKRQVLSLFVLTILWSFYRSNVSAQPDVEYQTYKFLYKNDDAVFLENRCDVIVTIGEEGVNVTEDTYEELMLLSNNVNAYSDFSVGYSEFNELLELDAHTMVPVKNKYRHFETKNIVDEKPIIQNIFYDDYMSKRVYFLGLMPGAKRVLSYKHLIKYPQLISAFYFQSYAPTIRASYSITVPKDMEIGYRLFNIGKEAVEFSSSEKNNLKTYTWKARDIDGYDLYAEEDVPAFRYLVPHLVVYLKEYSLNGKKNTILSGPGDLYKWYYDFIKDVNTSISPQLKQLADSLTQNETDEISRVKKIYYWVQENIRYVAFEDGLHGFIPRNADSVCHKRYGDCKDMASIITSMLKAVNIPAYPTWIGSRDLPYTYDQIPTPMVDNHMISCYINNDQYYFLDATANFLPFGYPSGFIQGKEALISIDKDNYRIIPVPEVDYSLSRSIDSMVIEINDRTILANGVRRLSGFKKQTASYLLSAVEQGDMKQAMESFLSTGSNKFILDSVSHSDIHELDEELTIDYSFHLPDYITRTSDEIYINLNLDKTFFNLLIDTAKRKHDKDNYYKYETVYSQSLIIPEGYEVSYLPENSSFDEGLFGFTMEYEESDNSVSLNKSIKVNYLLLRKSSFNDWNRFVKALNKAYGEAVVLKKS